MSFSHAGYMGKTKMCGKCRFEVVRIFFFSFVNFFEKSHRAATGDRTPICTFDRSKIMSRRHFVGHFEFSLLIFYFHSHMAIKKHIFLFFDFIMFSSISLFYLFFSFYPFILFNLFIFLSSIATSHFPYPFFLQSKLLS